MKALGYRDLADFGITYSREAIARLIKAGRFPASFKLSTNRIAWDEAEVTAWLAARMKKAAPAPVVQRAPRPVRWRRPIPMPAPPRRKRIGDVS